MPNTIDDNATDIIENNSGSVEIDGWNFTRIVKIKFSSIDEPEKVIHDAIEWVATNVDGSGADIGDEHPAFTDSAATGTCPLRRIEASNIEKSIVTLTLSYRTKEGAQDTEASPRISMQSSLVQIETSKEWDGAGNFVPIEPLGYYYDTKEDVPECLKDADGNLKSSVVEEDEKYLHTTTPKVPLPFPRRVKRYTYRTDDSEAQLENLNDALQGKVNDGEWNEYAARTWRCIGVNWDTEDFGNTFSVSIELEYAPEGFSYSDKYVNPDTAESPEDIFDSTQPIATREYELDTADFGALLG